MTVTEEMTWQRGRIGARGVLSSTAYREKINEANQNRGK